MTQTSTARRLAYLRREVHVLIVGAENSLCGVRLLGAVPIDQDPTGIAQVTCDRCSGHAFETVPGVWEKVQPIGPDSLGSIGGLPESTAGF